MEGAQALDQKVDGRFELIELAGRGGMASVYRAIDLATKLEVAVKIATAEEEVRARFDREAIALQAVTHPNVVGYISHGVLPGSQVYLVMEWIAGESLADRIRRGPMAVDEALVLGARIAHALAAVHACGLVHRDVKPGNVVLRDGDPTKPVLLDFGLAKPVVGDEITSVGLSVGTPGYMAPEQARGLAKLDSRADLFALGCLLFRCSTGERPFNGPTVTATLAKLLFDAPPSMRAIDPKISASLDALVMRLLIKDSADRPRDAALVAAELEGIAARRAHSAPRLRMDGALTPDELHPVTVVIVSDAALDTPTMIAPVEASEVLLRPVAAPIARNEVVAIASSFGGVAETLANGALVVVFQGAMNARDQCVRAARCALRLRALASGKTVALATGRARAARGEIVGEALDRAVRALERGSKDGPIQIDDASAQLLGPGFEVGRDPSLTLVSEKGEGFAQRTLLGVATPCVGRDAELGAVSLTWSQCVEDSVARIVLITADAGVGKSRLASEAVSRALERDPGASVWLARGDALTEHAPLALVGKLVRDQLGLLAGDPLAVRQNKLRARAASLAHPDGAAHAAEFLGELCDTPFDDADRPALKAARSDAQLMAKQLRLAFEELVVATAKAHPLLVVIEDLHWADGVSVSWIERALSRVAERPVLLLALSRPEGKARFETLFASGSHVQMKPLTAKASSKLARAVLGAEASAATIERVVELAAGNAFYLEELLRAVAEGHEELPQTVVLMAQARLHALDSDARRVLRAASVFGDTFAHDDVAALSDDEAAAEWLPRLAQLEVIAHAPGTADTFTFRHALLREAAYASLTDADRVLGHKLAARWLRANSDGNAMAVADHFARGEEPEDAVREYVRASEQALKAGDLLTPDVALSRALEHAPSSDARGRLLALVARAMWQRGDMAKAEQTGKEAMALLHPGEPYWYDALADVVNAMQGRLDHAGIAALSMELIAHPPLGPVTVSYARALTLAYTIVIQSSPDSDLARMLSKVVDEVAASDAVLDPVIDARFAIARAFAAVSKRHPSASALLDIAARRFEEMGNVMASQMQRTTQAIALSWLGAWEETIRVLTAIPESTSRPSRWARVYVAWPLAQLGRWDEGFASASRVLEQEHDDPFLIMETRLALGRLLVMRERCAEALEVVGVGLLDQSLPRQVLARLHAVAFEACFSSDRERAGVHARAIEACLADNVSFIEDSIYVRLVVVEWRRANGDVEGARVIAREAARMIRDYAALIEQPEHLAGYLERVPENARVLALAEELG